MNLIKIYSQRWEVTKTMQELIYRNILEIKEIEDSISNPRAVKTLHFDQNVGETILVLFVLCTVVAVCHEID